MTSRAYQQAVPWGWPRRLGHRVPLAGHAKASWSTQTSRLRRTGAPGARRSRAVRVPPRARRGGEGAATAAQNKQEKPKVGLPRPGGVLPATPQGRASPRGQSAPARRRCAFSRGNQSRGRWRGGDPRRRRRPPTWPRDRDAPPRAPPPRARGECRQQAAGNRLPGNCSLTWPGGGPNAEADCWPARGPQGDLRRSPRSLQAQDGRGRDGRCRRGAGGTRDRARGRRGPLLARGRKGGALSPPRSSPPCFSSQGKEFSREPDAAVSAWAIRSLRDFFGSQRDL